MAHCDAVGGSVHFIIHPRARTTAIIREEIANSTLSNRELAKKYNVHRHTIAKWRARDTFEDLSHRPHTLQTSLTEEQEQLVVELRKTLFLPIDDLLVVVREFILPTLSRSALGRTLKRHGVSNLKAMLRALESDTSKSQSIPSFKSYDPGFLHVDLKYLPKMADEDQHGYLFIAIDRATRWVFGKVKSDKTAASAEAFLSELLEACPFKINKILTDNGKEFTDRFIATGERQPTGNHPFDKTCNKHGVEHRLIKPRHPQTNGMVERFNGRVSEIIKTTAFNSRAHLEESLYRYIELYNHNIPQRNLDHKTPIQMLKQYQEDMPELFKSSVYDLTGLDN